MVARKVGEAIGIVAVALAVTLTGSHLAAQGRPDLPRPDSSRAPLLTRAPADSIRYQTAYLHVTELLQALQAGDATTMGTLLENAILSTTTCSRLSETIARVKSRVRTIPLSNGSMSLALFFDRVTIADSGKSQVVTADLIMVPASPSVLARGSVTLVLDSERAVWTREAGLLEGLCGL